MVTAKDSRKTSAIPPTTSFDGDLGAGPAFPLGATKAPGTFGVAGAAGLDGIEARVCTVGLPTERSALAGWIAGGIGMDGFD